MLNIKFEGNGKQAVIMASGSLGDILAQLSMTVSDIYKQMKKSAPLSRRNSGEHSPGLWSITTALCGTGS